MADCPFWVCNAVPAENATICVDIQHNSRVAFELKEGIQGRNRNRNSTERTILKKCFGNFKTFQFHRQTGRLLRLPHMEIVSDSKTSSHNMEESKFNWLCFTARLLLNLLEEIENNKTLPCTNADMTNKISSEKGDNTVNIDGCSEDCRLRSLEEKKRIKEIEDLHIKIAAMETKIKDLESQIKDLESQNTLLKQEAEDVKRRSLKITKELALKTEKGECFESVNDEFSNSNIARKLENLYDQDWVQVSRMMRKDFPKLEERQRINILSKLMKLSYEECVKITVRQLRQFLLLEDDEPIPVSGEEIISQRRRLYQKESTRTKVKRSVLEVLLSTEEAMQLHDEARESKVMAKLKVFYGKVIDSCWLVAISHPPIKLNFNVERMLFEECKERWTIYSMRKPVEDIITPEGTIVGVVWPSLELHDESACYKKGDFIVVIKGMKKKTVKHNECEFKNDLDN